MKESMRLVCVDGYVISYALIRKNIKNMHLRVDDNGWVTLSVPMRLKLKDADDFVIQNADFVFKSVARRMKAKQTDNSLLTFKEGERVTMFGKSYTLKPENGKDTVRVEGDNIIFSTNKISKKSHLALFNSFVQTECKRVFSDLLARYYPYFKQYVGETPPSLTVRSMRSVWGTCCAARNKITLNTKLFTKPMPAVEYVVVHEYCHFIYQNHSPAFYAEVEKVLPDWRERKQLLIKILNLS